MIDSEHSVGREIFSKAFKTVAENLVIGVAYLGVLTGAYQGLSSASLLAYDLSIDCDSQQIKDVIGEAKRRIAVERLIQNGIKNIEVRTRTERNYDNATRGVNHTLNHMNSFLDKPNVDVTLSDDKGKMGQVIDHRNCLVLVMYDD